MTATKTQLTGGAFQDSEGNVLANGSLKFKLNADNSVSGVGNIAAGIEVLVTLDSTGNVASSTSTPTAPNQYIWATDVMTTPNAFYRVTGYTAQGQPAWGPNNQQVTSGGVGGGTFSVGTWTPNQVFSWTPSVQSLALEVNDTPNLDQALLNLEAGTGITITDEGGGSVQISSTASVGTDQNVVTTPSWGGSSVWPLNGTYLGTMNTSGGTVFEQITSGMLIIQPTNWKATIGTVSSSTVVTLVIIQCTRGTGTVVASAAVTFGGLSSPTLAPAGLYQSDSINFPLVAGFDYYFALNTSTHLIGFNAPGTVQLGVTGGCVISSGNALPIGGTLPSWVGSSPEASNLIIFDLVSA